MRTNLLLCSAALLALSPLVAPDLSAAPLLCANKKGAVFTRQACKAKETAVDVASLVPTRPAVGVRVVAARNVSVPYNTVVPVPFDAVDFDTDAFFKPLSSNTTLIAPRDGVYTITANVEWDRPASGTITGQVAAEIDKTASVSERTLAISIAPYQSTFTGQSLSAVVRLAAGEGLQLNLVNETGMTLTASAPDKITTLAMVWLGP